MPKALYTNLNIYARNPQRHRVCRLRWPLLWLILRGYVQPELRRCDLLGVVTNQVPVSLAGFCPDAREREKGAKRRIRKQQRRCLRPLLWEGVARKVWQRFQICW